MKRVIFAGLLALVAPAGATETTLMQSGMERCVQFGVWAKEAMAGHQNNVPLIDIIGRIDTATDGWADKAEATSTMTRIAADAYTRNFYHVDKFKEMAAVNYQNEILSYCLR